MAKLIDSPIVITYPVEPIFNYRFETLVLKHYIYLLGEEGKQIKSQTVGYEDVKLECPEDWQELKWVVGNNRKMGFLRRNMEMIRKKIVKMARKNKTIRGMKKVQRFLRWSVVDDELSVRLVLENLWWPYLYWLSCQQSEDWIEKNCLTKYCQRCRKELVSFGYTDAQYLVKTFRSGMERLETFIGSNAKVIFEYPETNALFYALIHLIMNLPFENWMKNVLKEYPSVLRRYHTLHRLMNNGISKNFTWPQRNIVQQASMPQSEKNFLFQSFWWFLLQFAGIGGYLFYTLVTKQIVNKSNKKEWKSVLQQQQGME